MVTIRQISLIVLGLLLVLSFAYADNPYDDCIDDCDVINQECEDNCTFVGLPLNTCDANHSACYTDCAGIAIIDDEDGDGVQDSDDTLVGNVTIIRIAGFSNITFTLGGYNSTDAQASSLSGVQSVSIKTGEKPLVEMEVDFDDSNIDVSNLEIKLQNASSRHGIVVKGLESNNSDFRKTIFLERTKSDASVCAVDREIDDISEVSRYCDGENEYFFGDCENVETIAGVTCEIENDMFKISGLRHSGAVQLSFPGLYSGYYTVVYKNRVAGHREGYIMPGEAIEICMEPARPILEDEYIRFSFMAQFGMITVNEFYTPLPMMEQNVHIYP